MRSVFTYDPVTAANEATATGETAKTFADIRRTMGIPLVTSIWRGLAGMEDSLPRAWAIAEPLFRTGQPEAALARVIARAELPMPEPLTPTQLACVGIGAGELEKARAVIAAYNRSNGMNLVAFAAMIAPSRSGSSLDDAVPTFPEWRSFPALQSQSDIDPGIWDMIRRCNSIGARGPDAFVATLWRHLAHWPGLLALTHAAFAPLRSSGVVNAAMARTVDLAAAEGARMAGLHAGIDNLSEQARGTIEAYVTEPTVVARMVVVGHTLAKWLEPTSHHSK
jgi:hypothetical protein